MREYWSKARNRVDSESFLNFFKIKTKLGKEISESISIPTIGIGAGNYCDGQVLVSYDMLDINPGRKPKFVKNFMTGNSSIEEAVKLFISEVKSRKFPSADYSYE